MNSKIIVITGSSSGIGKATEELLATKGYTVIGLARSFGKGSLEKFNNNIFHIHCDITNSNEVYNCIEKVIKQFHRIDILINNAGSGITSTIEDLTDEDINNEININLKGQIYCIRAVSRYMRKQKSGHIINIISTGGRLTYPSIPLYNACKHAMLSITESLSWELKPWNIFITSIESGAIKTHFGKNMKRPQEDSPYSKYYQGAGKGFATMYKKTKTSEQVAEIIFKAIQTKKWKYNTSFTDLVWLWSYKLLPKNVYDFIIYRYFKLK